MLIPLTKRQEAILLFCAGYLVRYDRFPSHRAIMNEFGIHSTNGVADHLTKLEDKGYLEVAVEFDDRALMRFTDRGWQYVEVVEMFGSFAKPRKGDR